MEFSEVYNKVVGNKVTGTALRLAARFGSLVKCLGALGKLKSDFFCGGLLAPIV